MGGKPGFVDDLVAVAMITPCVLAFVPGLQDFVSRGFEVIGQAPAWYLGALGGVVAWAIGKPIAAGAGLGVTRRG